MTKQIGNRYEQNNKEGKSNKMYHLYQAFQNLLGAVEPLASSSYIDVRNPLEKSLCESVKENRWNHLLDRWSLAKREKWTFEQIISTLSEFLKQHKLCLPEENKTLTYVFRLRQRARESVASPQSIRTTKPMRELGIKS